MTNAKTNPLKAGVSSEANDEGTPSHYYKLGGGGACTYVTRDGISLRAPLGILTTWAPHHKAELDEAVAAGLFSLVPVNELKAQAELSDTKSIIGK